MMEKSSLTRVYDALSALQEVEERYLTYEQAQRAIQSTPGIIFFPDTTFRDILGKLESLHLVALDEQKERVFMISHSPRQPSCTEDGWDKYHREVDASLGPSVPSGF